MPIGGRVKSAVFVGSVSSGVQEEINQYLRKRTREEALRFILSLQAELKETTPVLSGFAAANWSPVVSAPGRLNLPPIRLARYQRFGYKDPEVLSGLAEEGQTKPAVVRVARSKQSRLEERLVLAFSNPKEIPRLVSVFNRVIYMNKLNHGYSDQAPKFFIEKAVRNVISRP